MRDPITFVAFIVSAFFIGAYLFTFGGSVSDDHSRWAQAGDFFGGTLGSFFMFLTAILMVKELKLQREDSAEARTELQITKLESGITAQIELLKVKLLEAGAEESQPISNIVLKVFSESSSEKSAADLHSALSSKPDLIATWVGLSGSLTQLKGLNEERYVNQIYMISITFRHRLCSALDDIVRIDASKDFSGHFPWD